MALTQTIKITFLACLVSWSPVTFAQWYGWDLWLTRDQQGQLYFQRGDYGEAAQRFENDYWRATAFYAAEQFQQAATLYARLGSADGWFNQGNALAHLEQYDSAIEAYQRALQLRPEWLQAQQNLELAIALAAKPKPVDDYGSGKATKIGADKVVFESGTERMKQAQQEISVQSQLSQQQLNELWMRRLQTTPADFLRNKFLYQLDQPDESLNGEPE